ncbi:alpha-galactosidase [Intrasporangium oryzae NRRL B-24470]|uniref:alpha-galactosidase n=1 Tax=Intrasporangium oryzae NRRL B-24470 TaxID=1386089 RepID=W9GAU2_9MICO|nr:alpha-galactosidase [Intrasporangium oryzae]EWT02347.1 alpha-galactosidase [Intrasporangium oryzae NRRL B-24470]
MAATRSNPSDRPDPTQPVFIESAGTALVVLPASDGSGLPEVLHWGATLEGGRAAYAAIVDATVAPVAPSAFDAPWPLTLLPGEADGWSGTPAYAGHRAGAAGAVRWGEVTCEASGSTLVTRATSSSGLALELRHALDEDGVLRVDAAVTNTAEADAPLDVAALRAMLPLPGRADEVLDLTGRWCRERSPQRSRLDHGTHLRASRRGRTGHDATLLLVAGTSGFGFRSGEVWAVHTAWSGNHEHLVEALPEGAGRHVSVLGGGELLAPGEVRLRTGETYAAPTVVFVHASDGLDGLSRRLHRSLRARAGHPSRPRPVVLNTWEAVYFDTDLGHLTSLADTAKRIGVERFVLDDGWFGGRRHDRAGLGDWVVSEEVWPAGLSPLVDHVKGLGLEFGLWFEPEMVNVDSDLVREHPDWVLRPADGYPRDWRFQQLLDLTNPDAFAQLLERISGLVERYGIDYIKWDHNRDLHEAVHTVERGGVRVVDAPAVHAQTLAFYALLDALRERHPALEIESCSSGGARVDLGVLEHTDRVWTSDCNDALERASIQRWTTLLVPPELVGSHIGPPTAHTTHRHVDLGFRMLMAIQGHAGLEWDITGCTDDELDALTAWTALVRELRPLLHSGDLVRADLPDDALQVTGTVARDGGRAAYVVARLVTSRNAVAGALPLPGLDPSRTYAVRVRPEAGLPALIQHAGPRWWEPALSEEGFVVPGSVLTGIGLPVPVLGPAQGYLLDVRAV